MGEKGADMAFKKGDLADPRERMIHDQLMARGINDLHVLQAFRSLRREDFVPEDMKPHAYEDRPLPIGGGQTISQPYMTALMTQALNLESDNVVLEIGTGSGFQTALLRLLSKEVLTVERFPHLSLRAEKLLGDLGFNNILFKAGDGSLGFEEECPFDRILVTAAAPSIPTPLIEQLATPGVLVIPMGDMSCQMLKRVTKTSAGISFEDLCSCVFVPLVGKGGFQE